MKLLTLFILGLFSQSIGFGQSNVKGTYTTKTENCSASFLFLPGGLFYYEGGCEDRSAILKGAYKITKDSVLLIADPSPLRYSIESEGAVANNERTFRVIDVEGQPLPYLKLFALPPSINKDTLSNLLVLITDSDGMLTLDTEQIADVSFDRHNTMRIDENNQYNWISLAKIKGSKSIVQFNYHRFCLKYPQINVGANLSNLKRVIPNETLIDSRQNIFIKQEIEDK